MIGIILKIKSWHPFSSVVIKMFLAWRVHLYVEIQSGSDANCINSILLPMTI